MEQNETKNNSDDNYTEYLTEIFTENIMEDSTNTTENLTDNNNSEISGGALTGGFLFFCILALYIIFKLNSFGYNQEQKNNVWYFLYMANNGTLIANGINILNIFDPNSGVLGEILNYGPCSATCIIFLVGSCILLCKLKCSFAFFESHFEFNTFCYLFGLIKFMWSLLGLTDPCCRINTVTVRVYADGHTEDDSCCVCIWNAFIYFLKRLSFVYSVIAFMIFFIFYFFIFLIAKLIYLLMIATCLKNKYQEYTGQINQNEVNNNANNQEIIPPVENNILVQNPSNIPPLQNNYFNRQYRQVIPPIQNYSIPVNNNYGNLNYNNVNYINNNIQNQNPVINLQIGNIQINANNLENNDNYEEQNVQKEQNEQHQQNVIQNNNQDYHHTNNIQSSENIMINKPSHDQDFLDLPSKEEVMTTNNNQQYTKPGNNNNEYPTIENNNKIKIYKKENSTKIERPEDNGPAPPEIIQINSNGVDCNINNDNHITEGICFANNIYMKNEEDEKSEREFK